MTAHQQLSVIIRNRAKLMSVPELVPDKQVSFALPTRFSNSPDTVWAIPTSQAVSSVLDNSHVALFYAPVRSLGSSLIEFEPHDNDSFAVMSSAHHQGGVKW